MRNTIVKKMKQAFTVGLLCPLLLLQFSFSGSSAFAMETTAPNIQGNTEQNCWNRLDMKCKVIVAAVTILGTLAGTAVGIYEAVKDDGADTTVVINNNIPNPSPTSAPSVEVTHSPSLLPSSTPTHSPSASPTPLLNIQMVTIPAGSAYTMGDSEQGSGGGASDELPTHSVTVSEFLIGRYEVTYGQWTAVRTWGSTNGYTDLTAGQAGSNAAGGAIIDGTANTHPVTYVRWDDAVKWCNALSEMKGLTPVYAVNGNTYRTGQSNIVVMNMNANGYRLLMEAEWEKAARGGVAGQVYPWGNTIDSSRAVYNSNEGGTLPIASKPAGVNAYGLYDMTGNVEEWIWDWYSSSYYNSSPSVNPVGPSSGTNRVIRGGSWPSNAGDCRVALRNYGYPTGAYNNLGFRLCRRSSR